MKGPCCELHTWKASLFNRRSHLFLLFFFFFSLLFLFSCSDFVFVCSFFSFVCFVQIMRHLAAYLLLVLGGKAAPTAADVKAVLAAAGIEGDDARIAALIKVPPPKRKKKKRMREQINLWRF